MEEVIQQTIQVIDFENLLQQKVKIQFSESVMLWAEIIEVVRLPQKSMGNRIPFSVVFKTEQLKEYYVQGIYLIHLPHSQQFEIFLVPLGPDSQGMKYEAIFS